MFTGIIESTGRVEAISDQQTNRHFTITSSISGSLRVDQSVSHNGVCLTVVAVNEQSHVVTAIAETMQKTNLGRLKAGDLVNLERCMPANGRFDGHIVQGHVDGIAIVTSVTNLNGSWQLDFEYESDLKEVTVEKGSICVNGVSLTCFNSHRNSFSVAIIPYTWEHTTFQQLKVGDEVNLEFDIVGKYVKRLLGKQ